MSSNAAADLEAAVRQVLETMCFADVLGESECRVTEGSLAMRVEFRGHSHGEVRLRMPAETAANLAACFLGKETTAEVTAAEAAQVAGELSNMVCGCFLSKHDSECLFDISPPEPYPAAAASLWPGMAQSYLLDSGCIHVELAFGQVQ